MIEWGGIRGARWCRALALAAMLGQAPIAGAQIRTDGSLGPRQALAGPVVVIGAELGQVRGPNLFHSFGRFDVRPGESATFTGPVSIVNVLGRVTGSRASFIHGPLRSAIPGANLFLINPNGVIFGPGAVLDVGGSFHVSTADVIRLADGGRFPARLTRPTVLSMAAPAAFGFLGAKPAAIAILGSLLLVGEGRSLSLAGGDVVVAGGVVAAPGGRVSIVSAGAPGEAPFDPATQSLDLAVGPGRGGRITLSNGASVDSLSAVRGGRIVIRGGRLLVADGAQAAVVNVGADAGEAVGIDVRVGEDVVIDDGLLRTITAGPARGGDVSVTAGRIELTGSGRIGAVSLGPGAAGAIRLSADSIAVRSELAEISNASFATGDAGAIAITSQRLILAGGAIQTFTADGRGGRVEVDTGELRLTGGGTIQSLADGAGRGGSLTIRATGSFSASGVDSFGLRSGVLASAAAGGAAGRVSVSTPALRLDGGVVGGLASGTGPGADIAIAVGRAVLTAGASVSSVTTGPGAGGSVTFTGTESVSISERSVVSASTAGAGDPGRVVIGAPVLVLSAGGRIGAPTDLAGSARAGDIVVDVGQLSLSSGAAITSSTLGPGAGGTVAIAARESVSVSGRDGAGVMSSISSLTAGAGDAGSVTVTAPVMIVDGGVVTTGTVGSGTAGDLTLTVGRLTLTGEADVGSSALSIPFGPPVTGRAGTVTVNASESIALSGPGTAINALTNNAASAGRISVSAPSLTVADGALISAATAGAGRGGDIRVRAGRLAITGGGSIDTTAQAAGDGGTVTVVATDSVTITGLDPTTGRASRLSSNSQGAGAGGDVIVRAPRIVLRDGGSLQARSFATGEAGNLTVAAGESFRSVGGSVTTDAANAGGGNIRITAPLLVQLVDSRITTSVQGGVGAGGNITIDPRFVVLDGSEVRADAFGGPGGNVSIVADVFLADRSVLSASSALGVPGVVDVQAPLTDISGSLVPLPEAVPQAAALLRATCRARSGGERASSFLVGRGALRPDPAGVLSSAVLEPPSAIPARAGRQPLPWVAFVPPCR
jgi:filamentous hemagglutinin family protein